MRAALKQARFPAVHFALRRVNRAAALTRIAEHPGPMDQGPPAVAGRPAVAESEETHCGGLPSAPARRPNSKSCLRYRQGRCRAADPAPSPSRYMTPIADAHFPMLAPGPVAREIGEGHRLARLPPWTGGGAFGSSFAIAARSESRRGARGNLSSSMARQIAAVTATCSSSVSANVGMVQTYALDRLRAERPVRAL
jgi:hypothetical protein